MATRPQTRGQQPARQRLGAVVQLPVGHLAIGNETNGWPGRSDARAHSSEARV